MKASQQKAMEMLMSYQEENDRLRAAVSDVAEAKGSESTRKGMASRGAAPSAVKAAPSSALPPPPPKTPAAEEGEGRTSPTASQVSME